jgi:hypothetical protein
MPAVALDEHEMPNGGGDFHGKHFQPPQKEQPNHWPGFPSARSQSWPPLRGLCQRPTQRKALGSFTKISGGLILNQPMEFGVAGLKP